VAFLESELAKHEASDERKSRTVKMHQMLVRASVVKLDGLYKTLEKTEREHTEFRNGTEEVMVKATFPTDAMVEELETKL